MRKHLHVIGLFFIVTGLYAQQDPQFSQNMFLKLPVNAGYAGTSGAICGTVVYRNQWVQFPGNPKTMLFTMDAPIPSLHGGGGLTVVSDKLGAANFLLARASYSYHMPVGETGLIGIGLEAGLLQASFAYNWIAPDGTHGELDPAIPNEGIKKGTFDIGLGAYYRTQQLYVGLSASHLPGNAEKLTGTEFKYQAARHYYILAGYDVILTSALTLRPSVHVKSDAAVTTFDGNVNLLWNNTVWGGVSYRLNDAIVPLIGFAWQTNAKSTLKIGYSYDIGISDAKPYHKNTHEILINYCIKFVPKVKNQSHINPRFLK